MSINRREVLAGAAIAAPLAAGFGTMGWAQNPPIVETQNGRLSGALDRGVYAFKGIPYAGSVEGTGRFLAPPPAPNWTGVRPALAYGAPSVQNNTDYSIWQDPKPAAENCLFLNVWTPSTSGKRPVMVWIHGGGYSSGSGGLPIYDGATLAKKGDVVVVTVNHRLNIFGYLHLAAFDKRYATSGNAGQLDLVESLRWVSKNIAAFGGDASNVTIFGESGGGAKVSTLMAMPEAKGLFHKAAIESGSSLGVMSAAAAEHSAKVVLDTLGIAATDVSKITQVPTNKLLATYIKLAGGGMSTGGERVSFGPVVDGISIPQQTWTPGAPALSRGVPLLVGTNGDEAVAFIDKGMYQPPSDDAQLRKRIQGNALFGTRLTDAQADRVIAHYRTETPKASRLDLLVRISTDIGMRGSAITQAERQLANGAPVYMYEFKWRTPCFGGAWALHGIEIPFVFGNLDYGVAWDGHDTAAQRAAADPQGHRFRLADATLGAWAAFARTGNPSHPGLANWRPYSLERRETMILDTRSEPVADPRGADRKLLDGVTRA